MSEEGEGDGESLKGDRRMSEGADRGDTTQTSYVTATSFSIVMDVHFLYQGISLSVNMSFDLKLSLF